ncbi:hypothetical protein BFJ72_g14793 [Fusarium proliferatum]|uniref:Glutathione S-transferase n=1 Tax=Gibberella intermedia TaxID=948311 RepID=A0A420RYE6_GIBIN|nr:hypothetical protein BFJ72_g14793 [Fusarium proliferatum]
MGTTLSPGDLDLVTAEVDRKYSTADLTIAVLAELEHGLPDPIAEHIELDLQKGDTRTSEYLENVNPNGLVPAIVHDGVSIWESAAVTMYLGETFGVKRSIKGVEGPILYPAPGTSRGEAMKWLVWTSTHLGMIAAQLHGSKKSESRGKLESKKALNDLQDKIRILDKVLQGQEFMLGDWYSIVDTHLWAFIRYLTYMGLELAAFPAVASWASKIEKRPALRDL